MEYGPQHALIRYRSAGGRQYLDRPPPTQVAKQDADHADREVRVYGEVHDRDGLTAKTQYPPVPGIEPLFGGKPPVQLGDDPVHQSDVGLLGLTIGPASWSSHRSPGALISDHPAAGS
jgi:hypothetical protein